MNKRKIGNIVCFIISLFLSGIGIALGRFLLLSGMFDLINNDVVGGIAVIAAIFSVAFLPLAGALLLFGIIIFVIALHLGRDNKKEEKQEDNVIKEVNTRNNLLVKMEMIIYIIWIGLYIFLGA